MHRFIASRTIVFALLAAAGAGEGVAAGDFTQQQPVELRVQLGDPRGALRFFPADLNLETGRLYRLVLTNPSMQKHYFSSDGLAQAVLTRKVQINGYDARPIAEVKGYIREIEVHPYGTAEWWFVALKAGRLTDLKCTIPGHAEGGMVGSITIR